MNLHQRVVALQFEKGITVICSLLYGLGITEFLVSECWYPFRL